MSRHRSVLRRLTETAASLTGARYAALGVIDPSGQGLERFVTTGVDAETYAAIGDLPRGRGLLGVLIHEAEIVRLHDIADDPRSVGFPPHHTPMHTFLGVPILLRGVAYGNLYLTEKHGGVDFTEEDEELVEKCLEIIRQEKRASTSLLQRRLRLGYTRAARIVDILEQRGILGPGEGAKPREILVDLDAAV